MNRNFLLAISLWCILILILYFYHIDNEKKFMMELVKLKAASLIDKDEATRQWGASHGGVYVPADERTPPNPYLNHVAERDIITNDGKNYTLMNPAYMMRQVMNDYETSSGIKTKLTSLKVLNPVNEPNVWEKKVLKFFEIERKVVSEVVNIDGKQYLHYMRPMETKKGCLKCHGHQGYKEGDIRGGLSVSIPMAPYLTRLNTALGRDLKIYGLILLLGLFGIYLIFRQNIKRDLERLSHAQKLKELNRKLEEKVKQRTLELINSNKKLKQEIVERTHAEQEVEKQYDFLANVMESLFHFFFKFAI